MKAMILGAYGQDGTYLTDYMVANGWNVLATGRSTPPSSPPWTGASNALLDVRDDAQFGALLRSFEPDVVVNLAAISSVAESWKKPEATIQLNGLAVYRLLETVRHHELQSRRCVRFLQAGSSEMYGGSEDIIVRASSSTRPVSPYGLSKAIAHDAVRIHREAYGSFRTNIVMFNHESPLRPIRYLTRRISINVARIGLGLQEVMRLRDLNVARDWGSAQEYAEAIGRIAELGTPQDFILATGVVTPLQDLLAAAFSEVGIDDWKRRVVHDPTGRRPIEPKPPRADPTRTWEAIKWQPLMHAEDVIKAMVRADLKRIRG